MQNQEKRELRELKRTLKRAGNKKRRRQFKKDLEERPEDAAYLEAGYGRYSSAKLNGIDHDSTRRRYAEPPGQS